MLGSYQICKSCKKLLILRKSKHNKSLICLQPKLNEALLEIFRINYVGSSPYITCLPSLYHLRLGPKDRFLILSSDGLYQYFTNEEAVFHVESFIASFPEGDPAQHLIEEVLFRAAKKFGKLYLLSPNMKFRKEINR